MKDQHLTLLFIQQKKNLKYLIKDFFITAEFLAL